MYSDIPIPGSETIEVPEPDVGDAVEVPPPSWSVERPEIVPEREPDDVDGELIGEVTTGFGRGRAEAAGTDAESRL